jgi:hypothetical protein
MLYVLIYKSYLLIILEFLPPAQTLLNEDRMSTNPVLSYILSMPLVHAGLVIVLPTLGITIVLMLMPPVLSALSGWRGAISNSQMQWDTVQLYFIFKVCPSLTSVTVMLPHCTPFTEYVMMLTKFCDLVITITDLVNTLIIHRREGASLLWH